MAKRPKQPTTAPPQYLLDQRPSSKGGKGGNGSMSGMSGMSSMRSMSSGMNGMGSMSGSSSSSSKGGKGRPLTTFERFPEEWARYDAEVDAKLLEFFGIRSERRRDR